MSISALHEWVWEGVEEPSTRKETYKGGIPVINEYVFPKRVHITNAFLAKHDQKALDAFDSSAFGIALGEGGIGKHAGRYHRITARGLVEGWSANKDFWNQRLTAALDLLPHFRVSQDNSLPITSCLQQAGLLFGSENFVSNEIRIELTEELKRLGGISYEPILDIANSTGMSFEDYARAIRYADYSHRLVSPHTAIMSMSYIEPPSSGVNYTTDIFARTLRSSGQSHTAWQWICAMSKRKESMAELADWAGELSDKGISPGDFHRVSKHDFMERKTLTMVLEGVLDVNIALSLGKGLLVNLL